MPARLTTPGGPPRLLVVVAHPDDETFGCGSLLLHAAARGAVTAVLCATRGEAGQRTEAVAADADLGVAREAELRGAAQLLGVRRVDVLDYLDSGMDGAPAPGSLAAARPDDVRDRVAKVLDDVRPDVVVTLDAGDGHRDHAFIRQATLAAVEQSARPPSRVYLQCLSQSLMREWLAHVAAEQPDSEHLTVDVPGTPDEDITTLVDTREHLGRRELAMAAHASQTSPYEGLPTDLRERFLTVERLRRIVPPWTGGPPEDDVFPPADDGRRP